MWMHFLNICSGDNNNVFVVFGAFDNNKILPPSSENKWIIVHQITVSSSLTIIIITYSLHPT